MSFVPPFRQTKAAGFGLAAAVALTLVWSCSSTEPPPPDTTPANVTPVTGTDNQTAMVGVSVATPPSVTVTNAAGTGLSGKSVTFAVTAGGGSVTGATATTDAQGVATVGSWTMGTTAGSNTLAATVGNVGTTFAATGTAGAAATMIITQGNDQTGPLTGPLPTNPTVRVTDQLGNGVSGVSVSFTPMSGEGTVNNATVVTDANGDAAVQWTPGRNGSNFMDVVAGGFATQFFSIRSNASYNIELRFVTAATMLQKQAFGNAAGDWMTAIGGNLAAIDFSSSPFPNSCGGLFNEPVLDTFVDDLLIWVVFAFIDGPDGVLAQAGPCLIRSTGNLPIVGGMKFDTADLPPSSGSLEDISLHEMGHVIGFGAGIWNLVNLNLFQNPSCTIVAGACNPDLPGADTHFTGANANARWVSVGGGGWIPPTSATSAVPLENSQGGPGTRDSHWRESTFVNELMTGFIT
ncbi:MAG: hypothetical protein O7E49_06125, partial [Gemmatimonadetes bacterium]|nr:hypothetical protein [Gemmatimonadota bacterium]